MPRRCRQAVGVRRALAQLARGGGSVLSPEQRSLLDETIDADITALDGELDNADPAGKQERARRQPKRRPLPPEPPRTERRHEPENTN